MRKIGVILSLIGIVSMFGCSSQSYSNKQLLEKDKESVSSSVAIASIRSTVESQVQRFIEVFSAYERTTIAEAVPDLYAEDAFLNDRIHSVEGARAIAAYFDGTFAKMHDSEFIIHDTMYATRDVYLRWTMRIQLAENAEYMEFLGMSQFRFNEDGKIIYHQDYWDFSELMGQIRGLRSLVGYVKSRA